MSWVDGTLYPDRPPPEKIVSLADRIDFLVRLCGAWDFGVLPDPETLTEVRRPEWREAVDQARILTSPVYHLLRRWHGLPRERYLSAPLPYIRDDPSLQFL